MKPLTSPEVVIGREHSGKARVSRLFRDLRREWLKAYAPSGPKGIIPEADEALLAAQGEAEAKAVALTQYWQERGRLERGVLLSTAGLPHTVQAVGKTKPKDTGVVDWELTAFSQKDTQSLFLVTTRAVDYDWLDVDVTCRNPRRRDRSYDYTGPEQQEIYLNVARLLGDIATCQESGTLKVSDRPW